MTKTKWLMDTAHSELQFKVRHMLISWVTGQFNKFNGSLETEGDDFSTAKAHVTADIASISTNNEQRDMHLQASDFFDAENHPQLVFDSEKIEKVDEENFKVYGTLTMRGVSKKIVLDAELGGIQVDRQGQTKAGFTLSGKISRKDFGVSFGIAEAGGVGLGEEVKISVNAQFAKQVEVPA